MRLTFFLAQMLKRFFTFFMFLLFMFFSYFPNFLQRKYCIHANVHRKTIVTVKLWLSQ